MKIEPRVIFLFDSVGALMTALMLSWVLVEYESIFGMPKSVFYTRGSIAGILAIVSFSAFSSPTTRWAFLLKTIALANISYCVVTSVLLVVFRNEITRYGVLYFAGEIIIIVLLARYQLITARRVADR